MLVEDEDAVRRFVQRLLERHGYRVQCASSGVEALQLAEAGAAAFDLVLTDLVMPGGVSGRDLGERLQATRPKLKVLYMSGYAGDLAGRGLDLREGVNFIQKPFPPALLLKCVRARLDAP